MKCARLIHVAATMSRASIGVVWRDVRAASESSPAALRLVAQRECAPLIHIAATMSRAGAPVQTGAQP